MNDDQLSRSLTNLVVPSVPSGIASAGGLLASPTPMRSPLGSPLDRSFKRQFDILGPAQFQVDQFAQQRPAEIPASQVPAEMLSTPITAEQPPAPASPAVGEQQVVGEQAADESRGVTDPATASNPVVLNVYWQRAVSYDANGRVERRLGTDLHLGMKLVKDLIGVYHVGVQVHGAEYTFGTYHAPNAMMVGDDSSGVTRHEPRRPGPGFEFKQDLPLGNTTKTQGEVELIGAELATRGYARINYNRIHQNCVDFARALCERLGVNEVPSWCYRGATTAKLLGIGGAPPTQGQPTSIRPEAAASYDGAVALPVADPAEVPPQGPAPAEVAATPSGVRVGDEVSVLSRGLKDFELNGNFCNDAIIESEEADGTYTVRYIATQKSEAGVGRQLIFPCARIQIQPHHGGLQPPPERPRACEPLCRDPPPPLAPSWPCSAGRWSYSESKAFLPMPQTATQPFVQRMPAGLATAPGTHMRYVPQVQPAAYAPPPVRRGLGPPPVLRYGDLNSTWRG